jgi:imidazolonepropionase-like amidohydrolase
VRRGGPGAAAALLAASLAASHAGAECVALTGGRLVLAGASPAPGTLVIEEDRVAAAGAGAVVPRGCRQVAVDGRVVTAGLIDLSASLGLTEIELEPATRDDDAGGTDPVRAAFRAADGYNPRSVLIPVARAGGVTSALVAPAGGLVSGQAAWVDLAGATQAEAVRKAPAAVAVGLEGPTGAALRRLRELLEDARLFVTRREAWERNASRAFPWNRSDLEALRPVIDGGIPLLVGADRASDIEALLRLAAEQAVRVVVRGGAEAHLVAAPLAAARVPVIVHPFVYGPGSYDQILARPDNAARLRAAGVTVAISTFSGYGVRKLRQLAGNAVREGLAWAEAFDAITVAPARILGMERYGALAPGAVANVVVWSGDPLEIDTSVEQIWIHGRPASLRSRQTDLFERYREHPARPRPALPLPVP